MTLSMQDLWNVYAQQLQQVVAPQFDATKQVIAFAGTTLAADLANANPNISNETIYSFGNTVPANSPSYAPLSDLCMSYSLFLQYINLGGSDDPNFDSQINLASEAVTNAQTNYQAQLMPAITAWNAYKQVDPTISFNDFVTANYPVYLQAQNALLAAQSSYNNLMTEKYGAGYAQIAAASNQVQQAQSFVSSNSMNMAVATGSVAPAGSTSVLPGQTPPPPASDLVSGYRPLYNLEGFTTVYQQWQANSTQGVTAIDIEIAGNSSVGTWSESGWDASASASLFEDFFSFTASGSASSTTMTVDTSAQQFSVSIKFTGLQSFVITPGEWYSQGLVTTYKNQLRANAPQFFGDGGSLGLLPTELIVGFEPKIVLTLSEQDYNSYKSTYQANGTTSIGIGPFKIGEASYSTYGSMQNIQCNDSTNTITIGPVATTMPVLLGVICTKQ